MDLPFPTTSRLDHFTRPDEGPPPSVNWTADIAGIGQAAGRVLSNEWDSSDGAGNSQWWNPMTCLDCEVGITIRETIGSHTVYARVRDPGLSTYDAYYYINWGVASLRFFHVNNGSTGQLGAVEGPAAPVITDRMGLRVTGTGAVVTLEAWLWQTGGPWTWLASREHTAGSRIITPGVIGFAGEGLHDDFFGGVVAPRTDVVPGWMGQWPTAVVPS